MVYANVDQSGKTNAHVGLWTIAFATSPGVHDNDGILQDFKKILNAGIVFLIFEALTTVLDMKNISLKESYAIISSCISSLAILMR